MRANSEQTAEELDALCELFEERCRELLRTATGAREHCDRLQQDLYLLDRRLGALRAQARPPAARAGCAVATLGDAASVRAQARSCAEALARRRAAHLRELAEAHDALLQAQRLHAHTLATLAVLKHRLEELSCQHQRGRARREESEWDALRRAGGTCEPAAKGGDAERVA